MKHLYEALIDYSDTDIYPYHMPGHKRQPSKLFLSEVHKYDITEIDDFDNLHEAQGIIEEVQKQAAKLYGSLECHYLINGSSSGIEAAICSTVRNGKTILMSRNAHKSAYYAARLNCLNVEYCIPCEITEYGIAGAVSAEEIEFRLRNNPEIEAVFITSPTYEGVVSDIASIAEISHRYNVPLIVDEAHGSHFFRGSMFPKSAVTNGADIVIQSLHKMLPSPTQTALIHICSDIINRDRLREYIRIFQSSSPSYLLMGAMDSCIDYISRKGIELSEEYIKRYNDFIDSTKNLKNLKVLTRKMLKEKTGKQFPVYDYDPCKIVIASNINGLSGKMIYDRLLADYHLQPEMAAGRYVLMMMSIMDKEEAFDRLLSSLLDLDKKAALMECPKDSCVRECKELSYGTQKMAESVMPIYEAMDAEYSDRYTVGCVKLEDAKDCVSHDFISIYPPGIPVVVPGEIIGSLEIERLKKALKEGLKVTGLKEDGFVTVLWEQSSTY